MLCLLRAMHGVLLLLCILLAGGCAVNSMGDAALSRESRSVPPRADIILPRRVAILPFHNETENPAAVDIVRQSFYSQFAVLNFADVELSVTDSLLREKNLFPDDTDISEVSGVTLGSLLRADGLLYGRVIGFNRIFLGMYSQVYVELEVRLVLAATGEEIWRAAHRTTLHEGGIPLVPLSAISTLLRTSLNVMDDQLLRAADELSRTILADVPEPAGSCPLAAENAAEAGAGAEILPPGRRVISSQEMFMLAMARYQAGELAGARLMLESAVRQEPADSGLRYHLGLVYLEEGERQKATAVWRHALLLDPGLTNARSLLNIYDQ